MGYDDDNEQEPAINYPAVFLDGEQVGYETLPEPDELERVQVSFPDTENGYQTDEQGAAPLGWVNSATITLDRRDDAVTLSISVGDPRGAFTLTVRRLPDGRLLMFAPHPTETMLHLPLAELRPGVYEIK